MYHKGVEFDEVSAADLTRLESERKQLLLPQIMSEADFVAGQSTIPNVEGVGKSFLFTVDGTLVSLVQMAKFGDDGYVFYYEGSGESDYALSYRTGVVALVEASSAPKKKRQRRPKRDKPTTVDTSDKG